MLTNKWYSDVPSADSPDLTERPSAVSSWTGEEVECGEAGQEARWRPRSLANVCFP